MSSTCDVCGSQPHKYKCPNCAVRYCSLACFKTHKLVHDTAPAAPDATAPPASQNDPPNVSSSSAPPPTSAPATQQQPPAPAADPFQRLLADPALQTLLRKHPTLRTQLHTIYTSTLEPTPEEWAEQQQQSARGGRGGWSRGGRGGRGRGGGRGGRGGQNARGPWKQETADKNAVGRVLRAQEQVDGEGMREFVELVQRVLGGETEGEAQEGRDADEGVEAVG